MADDLKHIAGGGLVFECLLQVVHAFAQFAEQARVLHCDDRLRRKILQQSDLLVCEWADFLAKYRYCAKQAIFFLQRHSDPGSRTCEVDQPPLSRTYTGIGFLVPAVQDVDKWLTGEQPTRACTLAKRNAPAGPNEFRKELWDISNCNIL